MVVWQTVAHLGYLSPVTGINETTGCMDPNAVNYNYTAAVDDGSCYYSGDVCSPIEMIGNNCHWC